MFVSTLLEIVEILRIDLDQDDDNIEVHFSTGRVPLLGESRRIISAVAFMNERVSVSFECLAVDD